MYTTNAIEAVNSSLRKVTKQGSFDSPDAVIKIFYLRITDLYKKWDGHSVQNWAKVLNQLAQYENLYSRITKYFDL